MHHGPQLKLRSSTAQPAFLRPTCHGKDRVAKSLNPSEQTTETCERLITQLHSISWSKEVPLRRSWIHSCTHPSSIAAGSTLAPLKSFSRISIQTFWWIVDTYGTYRIRILQNSKMQDIPQWCFFMFFWWVLELHCYFQTKGIQCCDTVQVPGHYWWSCIFPPKFQFFTLFHTAILQIFPFSHFCFNHRQSRSRSWGDGGPQQIATCQGLISKTCAPMNSENITNRTVENQAKRFRCFKKELSQGPSRSFLYLAFVCWYGRSLSSLFRHSLCSTSISSSISTFSYHRLSDCPWRSRSTVIRCVASTVQSAKYVKMLRLATEVQEGAMEEQAEMRRWHDDTKWQKECYWLVFTRVDWTDGINHEDVGKLWKAYANLAHLFASQSKSIFINMFPSHDSLIPSPSPSCYI